MADYNPKRSSLWNYGGPKWKLSRSKIELFTNCPRCFYIDNKLGTKRPSMPSFLINTAVDTQLKNEFDAYRRDGKAHPFQEEFQIDAIPAPHDKLNTWRENFEGVTCVHSETGMTICGAIDDLWINPKTGEYIVVDYKATAKDAPKSELTVGGFDDAYRKQMEIYQWLLRKNGLQVSNTGYFVYCTGRANEPTFDKKIEFDVVVIPYTGNDSWVDGTIRDIKQCLDSTEIPKSGARCEYCMWFNARLDWEKPPSIQTSQIVQEKVVVKRTISRISQKPIPPSNNTLF
jgi:PD-(D/E)XK nuclease superfamily